MKIKNLFFASVILAAVLTGCSKEDGTEAADSGELSVVKVQLTEGIEPGARALTDKVGDGTAVTFNSGYLLFANENNFLTTSVPIVTGTPVAGEVSYNALKAGTTISDVLSSSRKVYFIGNLPAGIVIPPTNTILDGFLNTAISLTSQSDGNGGVTVVSLYGEGDLTILSSAAATAAGYDATASFDVYPLMSRIEIEKFAIDATGEYSDDGVTPSTITDFNIEAIYVNYFYSQSAVNGKVAPANQITYTANASWTPGLETYYSAPYTGLVYDYEPVTGSTGGISKETSGEYLPIDDSEVWAYNAFSGGNVAHVIVRLTNIQGVSGINATDRRYLTIRGFNHNGTSLAGFKGGEIYTIDELLVHEDKLTELPEMEDYFRVNVQINMMNWTEVAVKPEY